MFNRLFASSDITRQLAGYSLFLWFIKVFIISAPALAQAQDEHLQQDLAHSHLQEILSGFGKVQYIHFSYTEIRHSPFFKEAQQSSGEIIFQQPRHIIKQVLKPQPRKYEIDNNELNISSLTSPHSNTFLLDNYPQLQEFIALLTALLSNNSQYISDNFHYDIETREKLWRIKLRKKTDIALLMSEQSPIKELLISGQDQHLLSIKTLGFGGESSEVIVDEILKKRDYANTQ